MTGVPKHDLDLFNCWEEVSGDDMVENKNGDREKFLDKKKKAFTEYSIDEELEDDTVNNDDLGKETQVLSGLLETLGLKYDSAVTMSCRTNQGMVICTMTCKVDILTSFNTEVARPNSSAAMLAATIETTYKLESKFFPEKFGSNQKLRERFVEVGKSSKETGPSFPSKLEEKELYCARVELEEEEVAAGATYQVLAEAECYVPTLSKDKCCEVIKVKNVPNTEAFVSNVNDSVVEQVNMENFLNSDTVLCNEGGPDSNRKPKQGGSFSSLDIMAKLSEDRSLTQEIKTPFSLLDKNTKELDHWSPRKKSPGKRSSSGFSEENKYSVLKKKPNKASGIFKKEVDIEPIAKINESLSSVFEFKDDSYDLEIKGRQKKDVDTIYKEMESNDELEEATDCMPSIDELLKPPERPEDGGMTMDEIMDELDIEIAERKKKHEEEMVMIDLNITAEKQRQEERRERMKNNAMLRDRLEAEVNELVLRRMFKENTEYLRNIEAGKVESSRHRAFHKSCRSRQALFYTMITDPFTDNQLKWTLEEMGKVWMKTKREQMDKDDYIWKVLLPECFIKFYMDHFKFDKKEAEKRISETPLGKALEDSEEDEM